MQEPCKAELPYIECQHMHALRGLILDVSVLVTVQHEKLTAGVRRTQ